MSVMSLYLIACSATKSSTEIINSKYVVGFTYLAGSKSSSMVFETFESSEWHVHIN